MKINMSLDKYDIDGLDEIYNTADDLYKRSELLESLGIAMSEKIIISAEEFSSSNYGRVKEATDDYLKKMKIMREELIELCKSCRELAEKIAEIWS